MDTPETIRVGKHRMFTKALIRDQFPEAYAPVGKDGRKDRVHTGAILVARRQDGSYECLADGHKEKRRPRRRKSSVTTKEHNRSETASRALRANGRQ